MSALEEPVSEESVSQVPVPDEARAGAETVEAESAAESVQLGSVRLDW